jgi:hypothetical protein
MKVAGTMVEWLKTTVENKHGLEMSVSISENLASWCNSGCLSELKFGQLVSNRASWSLTA